MSSHELIFSLETLNGLFLMLASLRPCAAPLASTSASAPIAPAAAATPVTPAARMNSRRFRYSFLSLISELRMSAGRLMSMVVIIKMMEPLRRCSREIARQYRQVPRRAPNPAVLFPFSRRCQCRQPRPEQGPVRSQPADQVDVFHERDVRVAAERLEQAPPHEQSLIPVRQREEPHACAHTGFDRSCRQQRRLELEPEATECGARIAIGRFDGVAPPRRQQRVGVKKNDPVAARDV